MKLGDNLRGITKLGSQYPRCLLIGTLVARPLDKIEEVAQLPTVVDLGVEYFSDLVLGLAINDNRRGWRFDTVRNGVWDARLQHGDMENRMDRSHAVRQTQYVRMHTCLANYFKRTEIFFSKLLRGSGRTEELSPNKCKGTEGKFRVGGSGSVSRDLVPRLGLSDVILQGGVQLVQIHGELVGLG